MKEIGILAHPSDDMLVPDLGQQRTARRSQDSPPLGSQAGGVSPQINVLYGLYQVLRHRHQSMTDPRPARADAGEERISVSEAPLGTHPPVG
jgi:hypothetical protein